MSLDSKQTAGDLLLVIDDDPLVLQSMQQILEVMGWSVLTAADGPQGIALFAHYRGQVGAVLLDLSMPGMDGVETLQALQQIDPEVRAILLSGHSEQEIAGHFPLPGTTQFLRKPFDLGVLVDAVTLILAEGE